MTDAYHPIDCSLHDRLESLATLGRTVEIRFQDESGAAQQVHDVIADVYARGGVEYLRTESGVTIRLDRLVSVDGRAFDDGHT